MLGKIIILYLLVHDNAEKQQLGVLVLCFLAGGYIIFAYGYSLSSGDKPFIYTAPEMLKYTFFVYQPASRSSRKNQNVTLEHDCGSNIPEFQ